MDYISARARLLQMVMPVTAEAAALEESTGRILAQEMTAKENVPAFDRSPYDGYAVYAADSQTASEVSPVTLQILEEVAAGEVPTKVVTSGTATKILTGAPLPEGADAIVMYEKTLFTNQTVTLKEPVKSGADIVLAGEDVPAGQLLAEKGTVIDAGIAGVLASQGVTRLMVYRRPRIGIISTGNEIVEPDEMVPAGRIRNANRYLLSAALRKHGFEAEYLGLAGDCENVIAGLLARGIARCDAVLVTGGVSVGDYDFTQTAMEMLEAEILVDGVAMKPGMACVYGISCQTLICGLSGNPASAMTNFYAVALPALRKLAGRKEYLLPDIKVTLAESFEKKSRAARFLRGRLDLSDGVVRMHLPAKQGNAVISSSIGNDVMAIVPAGSGPLTAGTILDGFLI